VILSGMELGISSVFLWDTEKMASWPYRLSALMSNILVHSFADTSDDLLETELGMELDFYSENRVYKLVGILDTVLELSAAELDCCFRNLSYLSFLLSPPLPSPPLLYQQTRRLTVHSKMKMRVCSRVLVHESLQSFASPFHSQPLLSIVRSTYHRKYYCQGVRRV